MGTFGGFASALRVRAALLGSGIVVTLSAGAWAADLPALPQIGRQQQAQPCFGSLYAYAMASPEECPLSWNGVTLYATIDVGVTHDSHGVPFNGAYPNGVETLISKNSNRSLTSIAPNGLGQSFVGLKGEEPIGASGWSLVFDAQTGFNP